LAEEGGRQQTKINILVSRKITIQNEYWLTSKQNHKTTFSFPNKPLVSKRCQDLIRNIIQEKDHRLCSKRYKVNNQLSSTHQSQDYAGRYVYPNDAEDIKSHKWFRDVQWDRLHTMTPPFVPNIKSMDDTQYFDEEDPISDFSESTSGPPPTAEEIAEALKPFSQEIQTIAKGFIERPNDSVKLKKVEREIDAFPMCEEQKEYLKGFVKHYGRKEKKRPRDRLLRDKDTAPKVLELRKKGAFLGYTYRRYRPCRQSMSKSSSSRQGSVVVGSGAAKRPVWPRARLSIH
jgi:protein-serine/threonine kinase